MSFRIWPTHPAYWLLWMVGCFWSLCCTVIFELSLFNLYSDFLHSPFITDQVAKQHKTHCYILDIKKKCDFITILPCNSHHKSINSCPTCVLKRETCLPKFSHQDLAQRNKATWKTLRSGSVFSIREVCYLLCPWVACWVPIEVNVLTFTRATT